MTAKKPIIKECKKKSYKISETTIREVENGYEILIKWNFNEHNDDDNSLQYSDRYIASTESAAMMLVSRVLMAAVADDNEDQD